MKKLKLFDLAWPMFVETALFMLLGFIDVFVLSRSDDLAASAVNTANQALSIVTIIFTVISGASAVLIAQYLGAGNRRAASLITALSLLFNFVTGVIVSAVILIFGRDILVAMGAKDEILRFSNDYFCIVGGFMFMQAVCGAMAVIVRNHGLTKITMYITVGMNFVNTALDIILVRGYFGFPEMGVTGAAVATTVSRALATVILAAVIFTKIEKPSIFRLLYPFPKKDLLDIFRIGIPSALETFLYNLSQVVITAIVLHCLSDTELVTKTYVQNITMFFYLLSVSIAQATQIITGHLVGAKQTDEAYHSCLGGYRTALITALSLSAAGAVFGRQLIGIYTDSPEVLALGAGIFIINIFLEAGRTTNLVIIAALRGAGDVYFPTICAVFSNWLISVLGSYILAVVAGLGLNGLWIALAADECIRGVLMLWRWRSGKWKEKRIEQEPLPEEKTEEEISNDRERKNAQRSALFRS